jgi:hypothetical protein
MTGINDDVVMRNSAVVARLTARLWREAMWEGVEPRNVNATD